MESVKTILLTGITGFIGRHVAEILLTRGYRVVALVRPDTSINRRRAFENRVDWIECSLSDIPTLRNVLSGRQFDGIIHVGALRGGRKYDRREFYRANVDATEQILLHARETNTKLVFCSSVGIFGAIPLELPANNLTTRQDDNYYHYTKITAEELVQRNVMNGLNAVIIRPAITYGSGDYGFPRTLTMLTDKNLLVLPDRPVRIHLTEVNTLAEAFVRAYERDLKPGLALIVADREPVLLSELADFIRGELGKPALPRNHYISRRWFELVTAITSKLHSELWKSRFELISRSWFYDTSETERELGLTGPDTIPTFRSVTDWYKQER